MMPKEMYTFVRVLPKLAATVSVSGLHHYVIISSPLQFSQRTFCIHTHVGEAEIDTDRFCSARLPTQCIAESDW
jgi:hypothetical protein